MQIEIDFEVFKSLTARRTREDHTYNDVIRNLLGLSAHEASTSASDSDAKRSFESRDLALPHGTLLRAAYKGHTYTAHIDDGRWIGVDGVQHPSPSAAARYITGNSVNGLRFWQGKRPSDTDWLNLDVLAILG